MTLTLQVVTSSIPISASLLNGRVQPAISPTPTNKIWYIIKLRQMLISLFIDVIKSTTEHGGTNSEINDVILCSFYWYAADMRKKLRQFNRLCSLGNGSQASILNTVQKYSQLKKWQEIDIART